MNIDTLHIRNNVAHLIWNLPRNNNGNFVTFFGCNGSTSLRSWQFMCCDDGLLGKMRCMMKIMRGWMIMMSFWMWNIEIEADRINGSGVSNSGSNIVEFLIASKNIFHDLLHNISKLNLL